MTLIPKKGFKRTLLSGGYFSTVAQVDTFYGTTNYNNTVLSHCNVVYISQSSNKQHILGTGKNNNNTTNADNNTTTTTNADDNNNIVNVGKENNNNQVAVFVYQERKS